MYNLKQKYGDWALITGASSGIGEAFSKILAGEQVNLVLTARRIERLNALGDALQKNYHIKVISIPADLSNEGDISRFIDECRDLKIGILINNAGAGNNVSFENSDLKKELDLLSLNCTAPVILTRYFLNGMIERRRGAVIFVGSIAGIIPNPIMSLYSASKAYNNVLGSALWYSQKRNNIDILSLAPGGTRTEFHQKANIKPGPVNASPEQVVHTAFRALGKKPLVVDGFVNKVMYVMSRLIPLKVLLIISGKLSQKRQKP